MLTKLTFGMVLIPLVYLIGFFQRNNAENIYKGLGLVLYTVGHFPNMLVLSILNFWSKDGARCNIGNESILLFISMLNPFSYNFFNPVLQYFICDEYTPLMTTVQWTLTFTHLTLGLILFCAVIKLEERSFLCIFKADEVMKSEDILRDIESAEDCFSGKRDGDMV